MLPKPKAEGEQPEHSTTPSPTEVADSSQGAKNPEKDQTLSPTEVVDSTAIDYETWFMQHGACETDGNDDGSDDDDGVATDEAAAMAELVQEASVANMTLQVLLAVKRPREEPEHIESAESEAELVKKTHRRRGRVKNILSHFDQMSRFVPFCPVSRAPGGKNPEKCYGHYGRPLVW